MGARAEAGLFTLLGGSGAEAKAGMSELSVRGRRREGPQLMTGQQMPCFENFEMCATGWSRFQRNEGKLVDPLALAGR